MKQLETYLHQLTELGVEYFPKVLLALVVLLIGWWITNRISNFVIRAFEKSDVNSVEVETFISSLINIGLKVLLILSVAGIVGVETTSFVGIIAAMSFAIGLALQGNLSNFAAGVMILLMRPFKVGDEVKIKGNWCFVHEIQIFHTVLKNFDNSLTIIPNSLVTSDVVQNLSASDKRKISIKLNIPYSEDLNKVEKIVTQAAFSVPEVDENTTPFFWIQGFDTHFIRISLSFSTTTKGFWSTEVKVNKAVLATLIENRIQIAYPEAVEFGEFGARTIGGQN